VGTLDSKERHRLLAANAAAMYTPPGHLLFVRDGTLMAQGVDLRTSTVVAAPVPLAERIQFLPLTGSARFTVAENGTLAYLTGSISFLPAKLAWFNRAGVRLSDVRAVDDVATFALSPDERLVAFSRLRSRVGMPFQSDLWLHDLARGTTSRFTFGPLSSIYPVWAPDGLQLVFAGVTLSGQTPDPGSWGLYIKPASGVEQEKKLFESPTIGPSDWSRDGRFIVYEVHDAKDSGDLWVLPMGDDRKPILVAGTGFHEQDGQFSPDGRWLAYSSDETGRFEVYVRSFPGPKSRWQISTDGGRQPRWRKDGRELFYLSGDAKLMAVRVGPGSSFKAGVPHQLFQTSAVGDEGYHVTADGQRFLLPVRAEPRSDLITVVLNWTGALKKNR